MGMIKLLSAPIRGIVTELLSISSGEAICFG
jgi:hypothetical protein